MNCASVKELINSVFDGEVPVETIAAANHHIEGCADCHTQYRDIESLREKIVEYVDKIPIPAGLEERVRSSINREANSRRPQSEGFLIAAACILLLGLGSFLISAQRNGGIQSALAPTTQAVVANQTKPTTVALDDLVNHTKQHTVNYVDYSPKQLAELSKTSGFVVKPMQLPGWQIADVCICDVGNHGQSVVHITYSKMEGRKRKFLTCYQSLKHTFECSQMYLESGGGREIRCARDGRLAIAYTSDEDLENIFMAVMPVKDLVHIARGA
jgi:hypothetical protein